MATSKQIALAFVEDYIDRDPEFMDVIEFCDEQYPENKAPYGDVYDSVVDYLTLIRDRLEMLTED